MYFCEGHAGLDGIGGSGGIGQVDGNNAMNRVKVYTFSNKYEVLASEFIQSDEISGKNGILSDDEVQRPADNPIIITDDPPSFMKSLREEYHFKK